MIDLEKLHLLEPFWKAGTVHREGLFFIQEADDQPPSARLLLAPDKVVELASATGEVLYEPGRDYQVDSAGPRVTLTPGSRIPFRRRADMYLPKGSPNSIPHLVGDENTHLYFSEGHAFHFLQAEATYTTCARWEGFVPRYAGGDLPRTLGKLGGGLGLSMAVVGDSISAGGNASLDVPPFMPAFPELVRLVLTKVYGGPVELVNLAKGGTGAGYGVEVAPQVAALRPDLVFIAFGMNDVGGRKSEGYRKRVAQIMQIVQSGSPQAEFILVATMRANPQWALSPADQFAPYRDALAGLCGPGAVLANVTSLWTDLLARKNYHDLTGNGVNHANDYGHRLYAQVILSLLVQGLTPKP